MPRQSLDELVKRSMTVLDVDPKVLITLNDGKTYTIEYVNSTMLALLQDTGLNIIMGIPGDKLSDPTVTLAVLYWGLRRHHPDLTKEQLSDLMSLRHTTYYWMVLTQACSMVQPEEDPNNKLFVVGDKREGDAPLDPTVPLDASGSSSEQSLLNSLA